jgi:hypothetical protein
VPGQRLGMPPKPYVPPPVPAGVMNKTDPDSRMMRTQGQPTIQGYNSQAAVTRGQIIVAAEIAVESPDFGHLEPAVRAVLRELEDAGVTQRPETVLADAGYWQTRQMEKIVSDGLAVLVAPDAGLREGTRPGWDKGPLRVHASSARQRGRTRALQAPKGNGRAGLRPEQVQPRLPPFPAARQSRGALGVAVPGSHPQPVEASQPLDTPNDRLSGQGNAAPVSEAPALPGARTSGRPADRAAQSVPKQEQDRRVPGLPVSLGGWDGWTLLRPSQAPAVACQPIE